MRAIFVGAGAWALLAGFAACSSSSDGGVGGAGGMSGGEANASGGGVASGGSFAQAGAGGTSSGSGGFAGGYRAGTAGTHSAGGAAGDESVGPGGEGGASGDASAAACAPSDRGCDGLRPLSCQGGRLLPNGAACAYACDSGACSGQCAVGETRCDGKVFETCGPNNLWKAGTACAFVCDDAEGCIGSCAPGTLKCASATELDSCNAQGKFEKKTSCDLACATVTGIPKCVECTTGDGLCPGGCTRAEDADCAVDPLSSCPNIFLGAGRYRAPQPLDLANTSIAASSTLKVGVGEIVAVTMYNHGTDDSPPLTIELLWGDASDGCTNGLHHIASFGLLGVPGTNGTEDGSTAQSFLFTPDASALATNGGHICLVARMSETSAPDRSGCVQQSYSSASPASDPLSGVFEMQIQSAN